MSWSDAPYSFNGGTYYLIASDRNRLEPKPKGAVVAEWRNIPYATSNKNALVTVGQEGPTSWSPSGGIRIPTEADFDAIWDAAGVEFFDLETPWGTKTARLVPESVQIAPTTYGTWEGPCTFEWTT